jgi:MATE family multidrug resistance protein
MTMSLTDTIVAGNLGQVELAAVGMGGTTYFFVWIAAMGLLMGIDPVVSQALGRGDHIRATHGYSTAVWIAITLGLVLALYSVHVSAALLALGYDPWLISHVDSYLTVMAFGAVPNLFFLAAATYLSARADTRVMATAAVLANIFNLGGNFLFTLGWFGLPKLGVAGIGLSTILSQFAEAAFVLWVMRRRGPRASTLPATLRLDPAVFRDTVRLGAPVCVQYLLEFSGFAAGTFLVARFGAAALGGHHVAMNFAGLTFTAALGVSGAASALVGQATGRGDKEAVRAVAWAAWGSGLVFATCTAVIMVLGRRWIADVYTDDPAVLTMAMSFLVLAAFFQLADTTQAIGFGICRGMGDTRVPAIINAVAYWGVGMPAGIYVSFAMMNRPEPIWVGFIVALFAVAAALVVRFNVLLGRLPDHRLEPVEPLLEGTDVRAEREPDMLREA